MDSTTGIGLGASVTGAGALAYGTKQMLDGRSTVRAMQTVPAATEAMAESREHLTFVKGVAQDFGDIARRLPKDVGGAVFNPIKNIQLAREAAAKLPPGRLGEGADHIVHMLDDWERVAEISINDRANLPKVSGAFTRGAAAAMAGTALLTAGGLLALDGALG
jgi:hypothetical protein